MAHLTAISAVYARLKTEWTETPVLEMNDLSAKAPADGSAFLAVQFPLSRSSRFSVGERVYREEGGIRFVLSTPRGNGWQDPVAQAERLAAIFRDQKFGGITTQAPGSPFLDDGNDNGKYFVVAFVVPYYFDFSDEGG